MKQDKKPKIKLRRHKLTSIVFPAVGGAIVVGGAAAGIAVGMINFPPFAADQPEIVLDPHNPVTKVTFNVKDKIDGDVTLTMGSTQSNDEEATQVIFNNESGQKDIVKPEGGKVVTEVTLSNPPTKTGKYEYSYNITATYSTEGQEVERVISGLKLSLEVIQEFVTIDDSNVEGLDQIVTLENQIYQKVELKGFRYHGDINKNNFAIDMSNVIFDEDKIERITPSIEFHENETFDVILDLYGPSEATITGSLKYVYAGEQVGDTESTLNITVHEQNTILRPAVAFDSPSLNANGYIGFTGEPNTIAKFTGLPYTGFVGKSKDDIIVENNFIDSLYGDDKNAYKFAAHVSALHTEDLQNKTLDVEVEIRVRDEAAAAKTLNDIRGDLTFNCSELQQPITLKDFSISLLESNAIGAPTVMPESFKIKPDTKNKIVFPGWSYSGLQNVSNETLKVTSDDAGEGKNFTKWEIEHIQPTLQTFDLVTYTNKSDYDEKSSYTLSNLKFQYKGVGETEYEDVFCATNSLTINLAHADDIQYTNATYSNQVKMDKNGMVTVQFSNLTYTGFETQTLRDGLRVIPSFVDSTGEDIPCEAANIKFEDDQLHFSFDILFSGSAIKTYTFVKEKCNIRFVSDTSDPKVDIIYQPANGLVIQEANSITDPAMTETFTAQMDYTNTVLIHINDFHYSGLENLTPEAKTSLKVDVSELIGSGKLPAGTTAAVTTVDTASKMFDITITVPVTDPYTDIPASGHIKFTYGTGSDAFEHTTKLVNVKCTTAPLIKTDEVVCPKSQQMVNGSLLVKLEGFSTQGILTQPQVQPKGTTVLPYSCEIKNWNLSEGKATFDVWVTITSSTKLRSDVNEVLDFTFKDSQGSTINFDSSYEPFKITILAENGVEDITTKTASTQFDYTSKKASVTYKGFKVIGMKKESGQHWSDLIVADSSFTYTGLDFAYEIKDDAYTADPTKFDLTITITASTQDATLIPWSFKNKELYFNYKNKPAENIETLSGFEMSIGAANYIYDVTDSMKTKTGKIDATSKTAKIYLGYFDYSGFATAEEQEALTVATGASGVTMSRTFKPSTHCIEVYATFTKAATNLPFSFDFMFGQTKIKTSANWKITIYPTNGVTDTAIGYNQTITLSKTQTTATVELTGYTYSGFETQEQKNTLIATTYNLKNAILESTNIQWYTEGGHNKFKVILNLSHLSTSKTPITADYLLLSWGNGTEAEQLKTKALQMTVVPAPVETIINDTFVTERTQTGYFDQSLQCKIRYSGFKYEGDQIKTADDIEVTTTLPSKTDMTITPVVELDTANKTFDVVITFKAQNLPASYECANALLLFKSKKLDGSEYRFFSTGYRVVIENPISITDITTASKDAGTKTFTSSAPTINIDFSGFTSTCASSFEGLQNYIDVAIVNYDTKNKIGINSHTFNILSNKLSINFSNLSITLADPSFDFTFDVVISLRESDSKTHKILESKGYKIKFTFES